MEIVKLEPEHVLIWNEFCENNTGAWFWNTTHFLDFCIASKPESDPQNLSFMVTENKEILAICPLVAEGDRFSLAGLPNWAPVFADSLPPKKREKVVSFVFAHIDKIATTNTTNTTNIQYGSFSIWPLSFPRYNYLMKQGYGNISINTQVVDLTHDLKYIHGAMRKGHDYDTDRGLKQLTTFVVDTEFMKAFPSSAEIIFNKYCELHHKDAGRVTRPLESFQMQLDWIRDGHGILIGTFETPTSAFIAHEQIYLGFSYVNTYKNSAYYSSACSAETQLPVGHMLTWKTIEYLKEHGFEYYELGWQQYGPQLYDQPSKKETEISFFKRGFGGFTIPLFRGEKFYSRDLFMRTSLTRMNEYAGTIE